jgi:APA family basic amino acid/polyamine antiporter
MRRTAMPTEPTSLVRTIRLHHAVAMVVGTIIGASIFVQPSEVTGRVPTIGGIFAVWIVSGVLTAFGALACAELASAFPRSGGVYVFLKEVYSPLLGFLWGWAMFWTMHSGIIAAIASIFARSVATFAPLGDPGTRVVAIAAIWIISAVNYAGVRHGTLLQTVFTGVKLAAIGIILILTLSLGSALPAHFVSSPNDTSTLADFVLAIVAGLFAFGGWHMVTYSAEETVSPERTIPRALAIGVALVTVCYIALNAAYLYVLPLQDVIASRLVAADAAEALVGTPGAVGVSALVVVSTFGALSGIVLAGPRVYFSMARDGLLFQWVAALHPTFRTPHRAIMLQALWSSILVATGTYRMLFTRVVYTEWIFFGLMAAGLFVLRRRSGYRPPYTMWGHPITSGVFVVSSFAIVLTQIASDPTESAQGLGLVALGIPVYLWWARPRPIERALSGS